MSQLSYPDRILIPAVVLHDSEHHPPLVWFRVSGGLFEWLIVYYPDSFSRMGWGPIGILAHIILSLIQATLVLSLSFFHFYGLVASLDLIGFLPEALHVI